MSEPMTIRVSGGFGPVDERHPDMSPSLRARIAQSDAEDAAAAERAERAHRARWEASHERAVDEAARQLAAEQGIPLREALREVGHTVPEFLALASARMDLEDAQRRDRQRQALRRAGVDPDTGGDLEQLHPSDIAIEAAVALAPRSESAEAIGKGVRRRWLAKQYRRME
jgi:hypothetical protein